MQQLPRRRAAALLAFALLAAVAAAQPCIECKDCMVRASAPGAA
jgi:hypothetical protein